MRIRCRTPLVAGALLALGAVAPLRAQSNGDGFMFHAPEGRLTVRAGYDHANAHSDVFDQSVDLLTLKRGDFSGVTLGGEAALSLGARFDISADLSYSHKSKGSEYRNLIDNNNQPIQQNTTFDRVPLTVNGRFYLTEPGRSIGNFAWIPSRVVPWVGAGAGFMWYQFHQTGDFVDYKNNNVFTATNDEFSTSDWTGVYQAMGGADISLSPHVALRLDSRYVWAKAPLGRAFSGFVDKIDLSGVQGTLGLTYRL
ncbi:hypothetical protein BH11GEM2_BH11GEM2_30710 [soil metagenome]